MIRRALVTGRNVNRFVTMGWREGGHGSIVLQWSPCHCSEALHGETGRYGVHEWIDGMREGFGG